MSELSPEELISAYLDGELTPADAARAERLLADDPAMRRLHDELVALSGTLKSLPHDSLGEGFHEHVLRQAERHMLTASTDAQYSEPTSAGAAPETSETETRTARWVRPLMWSVASVAAALVIMTLFPDEPAPRAVSVAPGRDTPSADDLAGISRSESVIRAAIESEESAPASSDVELRATDLAVDAFAIEGVESDDRSGERPAVEAMSKGGAENEDLRIAGRAGSSVVTPADDVELLIIQVDAPRAAVDAGEFDTLLVANGINWSERDGRSASLGRRAAPELGDVDATLADDVEVIYVEASRSQVEQTLSDLVQKPTVFSNFRLDPAPTVSWQQALPRQYGTPHRYSSRSTVPKNESGERSPQAGGTRPLVAAAPEPAKPSATPAEPLTAAIQQRTAAPAAGTSHARRMQQKRD